MLSYALKNVVILILIPLHEVAPQISIVNKSVIALERYSVGLQLYVQVYNQFKDQSCRIMSWCDRCCLTEPEGEECDGMRAYGGDMGILKPKERKVLIYVYPTRYLHDLFGYCDINVYYSCDLRNNGRKTIHLPFDTRIYVESKKRTSCGMFKNYLTSDLKLTRCSTVDLNPLDKCSPVNCDRKYGGYRPFYDRAKKRCVEAPACVGTATKELPDVAYVPKGNICRDLKQALLPEDIDAISLGLGVVSQSSNRDKSFRSTNRIMNLYDKISRNMKYLKNNIFGNPYAKTSARSANSKVKIFNNIITIFHYVILAVLISFILVSVMNLVFWARCRCSSGSGKIRPACNLKKTLRKFKRNKKRKDVKNTVIREVIMRGIPSELRGHALPHVRSPTKRYRARDIENKLGTSRSDLDAQNSETTSMASVDCDPSECDCLLH